ncbi:MAG TPA: tetratricopeptide repeat protein [Gemmatimonadaceae bacterium]|jgi:predicted Zn-dependent protease
MFRPHLHPSTLALVTLFAAAACGGTNNTPKSSEPAVATTPVAAVPESIVAAPVPDSLSIPPNVSYEAADSAYRARRYAVATAMFAAYTARRPENPWGHYMLGLSAWKAGQLDHARGAFEDVLKLDPHHVKSLVNLSRVLLEQQQVAEARERIEAAIAIDSGSVDAWRVLGRVNGQAGHVDDALNAYRTALTLDPQDTWSMNNMGLLLIGAGRFDEALGPLARAVQLDDRVAAFQNNLGIALERTGHITLAAQAYHAALAIDSSYTKAQVSLGRIDGKSDQPGVDSVTVGSLADAFAERAMTSVAKQDSTK